MTKDNFCFDERYFIQLSLNKYFLVLLVESMLHEISLFPPSLLSIKFYCFIFQVDFHAKHVGTHE